MAPTFLRYRILLEPQQKEILLAFLNEMPFEAFEELESELHAYIPNTHDLPALERALADLQQRYPFRYEKGEIAAKNWNAEWEAGFQPVRVEQFCGIRADFHPLMQDVKHEIIINPRMAFGTGHHETTYMMIQLMREQPFQGAKVLDYGCGTGILAILASKLGAAVIDAVDIEAEAYQNTLDNCQINHVDNVQVYQGTLNHIFDNGYQFILANINRNVIIDSLSVLHQKLDKRGTLLISGILKTDVPMLKPLLVELGFTVNEQLFRGNWACLQLLK